MNKLAIIKDLSTVKQIIDIHYERKNYSGIISIYQIWKFIIKQYLTDDVLLTKIFNAHIYINRLNEASLIYQSNDIDIIETLEFIKQIKNKDQFNAIESMLLEYNNDLRTSDEISMYSKQCFIQRKTTIMAIINDLIYGDMVNLIMAYF